jgi:hypothetical protein
MKISTLAVKILKKKQRIRGKEPIHDETLFITIDQKLKMFFNVLRKV